MAKVGAAKESPAKTRRRVVRKKAAKSTGLEPSACGLAIDSGEATDIAALVREEGGAVVGA
jgi:hypothetical protein